MRPRKPSQRTVWRITAQAPQGEFADPDAAPVKPSDASRMDEEVEGGWFGSSFDLLSGLDVKESGSDDLFDHHFSAPPPSAPSPSRSAPAKTISKHQWLLRFALRTAELDRQAEAKAVIALARELWPSVGHLVPEDVAQSRHEQHRRTP